jgi:hypothetical protein
MFRYHFSNLERLQLPPKNSTITNIFFNMVVQGICDANQVFWIVCVGQPYGVHHGGQFKYFILYK